MSQQYVPVGAYEREVMSDGVIVYLILTIMGICCFFINVPLLYILLKLPRCRTDSKLIICLVCGDMFNCLAITVMSYTRRDLYKEGLRTGLLAIQTQETCAKQPSMWLRSIWGCFISILIVMAFCGTAAITAFIFPRSDSVKFDCGRKATFTRTYSKIVYYFEIFGYVIGLVLNAAAYFRCRSVMVNNVVSRQVRQIRYYLTIAVISTLLVAMPDTKQIILGFLRNKKNALHDWLSQLFNTMSLLASSNNLFVYLALSRAFRKEFFETFSTQKLIKRRPPVSVLYVRRNR
ncbi:unnamed protein product [Cylicocyclus nassatus]|uniref:G-protein coupled receptors family 1 profile domain-containing protein n=1 Tax=Cylicocyclus nassatus TaxID=53992 RepID=A0AA36GY07_CYLNA|nr:unnamed protein product [Cylicocyclus nassatus]